MSAMAELLSNTSWLRAKHVAKVGWVAFSDLRGGGGNLGKKERTAQNLMTFIRP